MCMIYVAGYESNDYDYETEILVPDSLKQKINFSNDFKRVRFLYPHVNLEKDLIIIINNIDQANYIVKIYANSETTPFKQYNLTQNKNYYISHNDIIEHCNKNTLCSITVDVNFIAASEQTDKPKIEFIISQIDDEDDNLNKYINI